MCLHFFVCNIYFAAASHFLLVMLSLLFLSHLYLVCTAYLTFTGPVDPVFERLWRPCSLTSTGTYLQFATFVRGICEF